MTAVRVLAILTAFGVLNLPLLVADEAVEASVATDKAGKISGLRFDLYLPLPLK